MISGITFSDSMINKNFGQNFGKIGLNRLLFGRLSVENPQFKFKKILNLAIFEKILELFFTRFRNML